jgi:hypothetical protein
MNVMRGKIMLVEKMRWEEKKIVSKIHDIKLLMHC